jgi:acetyltransferase-like isoleucine patch superfamily enzyme
MPGGLLRSGAQTAVRAFVHVVVCPLALLWIIYHAASGRNTLFASLSQVLSLWPGKSGAYVRRAFYQQTLAQCGNNVLIEFGTLLNYPTTRIARGVYIGTNCTLGMVSIGEGTMIGSNVDILSSRRQHRREGTRLLGAESGTFTQVSIGPNTWIGNGAVIMANVGRDCTVGAATVVVKDVADGATVVGNPARVVHVTTAAESRTS